ncbi:hypothetical protein D9758_009152 [Tetrapyrgos nigripes]|uniref:MYND-type domain-containing protein n=1 Tax=Tetrapyrgos nigripes TaxID=182062 RepID=A0A8H5G8N1_9AGAR|nr:hypothetical protein D9758_009152 [Tetrapyrgos nigripes]
MPRHAKTSKPKSANRHFEMPLKNPTDCDCEKCRANEEAHIVTVSLDLAYRHLRRPVPTFQSIDWSQPSDQIELALFYLEALVFHLNNRPQTPAQRHKAIAEYKANFSYTWSWTSSLVRSVLKDVPRTIEKRVQQDRAIAILPRVVVIPTDDGSGIDSAWTLLVMERFPKFFALFTQALIDVLNTPRHPSLASTMLELLDFILSATTASPDPELSFRVVDSFGNAPGSMIYLFSYVSKEIRKHPSDPFFRPSELKYALRILLFMARCSTVFVISLFHLHFPVHSFYRWCRVLLSPQRLVDFVENSEDKEGSHRDLAQASVKANSYAETTLYLVKCIVEVFRIAINLFGPPPMVLFLHGGLLHSLIFASNLIVYDEARPVAPAYFRQGLRPNHDKANGTRGNDIGTVNGTLGDMLKDILQLLPSMVACTRILNLFLESLKRIEEVEFSFFDLTDSEDEDEDAESVHEDEASEDEDDDRDRDAEREVLRTHRKLVKVFMDNIVPDSPNPTLGHLATVWQDIVDHAPGAKDLRQEFEDLGFVICVNPECPFQGTSLRTKLRRLRCAKCKTTIYCSRSCQKWDWKYHNHREDCDSLYTSGLLRPILTKVDERFIEWTGDQRQTA